MSFKALWKLGGPLALACLAGCSSASDKSGVEVDAGPSEQLVALFRRPLCSVCGTTRCAHLQGLEKTACMRECNLHCVTDCALCKGQCHLGEKAALTACFETCSKTPACTERAAHCGNGRVEGAEGCDDSNTRPRDGCSATCEVEPCACGDRVLCRDGSEECDDGNTQDGDGCSASCKCAADAGDCGVARF